MTFQFLMYMFFFCEICFPICDYASYVDDDTPCKVGDNTDQVL